MTSSSRNTRSVRLTGMVVLLALFLAPALMPGTARAQGDFEGHWEGAIELPGAELGVRVDLRHTEEGWTGTIDIPMQGAEGLPLSGFEVSGTGIRFAIQGVPGDPTFDGRLEEDGVIRGPFRQSGQEFTFRLSRAEWLSEPARPQTPEPPFPYRAEEITYPVDEEVMLAATLTLPEGDGPFPAAVLISGSGAQDRDEEIFGHRPFAVIADHLTRHGIAVLRADDRGVGGSTGSLAGSTTSDFVDDALAGVGTLAARAEIDPERIGLIGHSEGGLVAPMAASRSEQVAFIILLAGTGVPLDEVILEQTELISVTERQVTPEQAARQRELQAELLRLAKSGADSTRLMEAMTALTDYQLSLLAPSGRVDPEQVERAARSGLASLLDPWTLHVMDLDPRTFLRQVRVPVLTLNGSRDLQVDAEQNLPEIMEALLEGGNEDVTARVLPGLNHLFQPAGTGGVSEYARIETTVDPSVLEILSRWIMERFGG